MTENEWLSLDDTEKKIEFLRDRVSDRKLRLVGCACCRMFWSVLPLAWRKAVQVAESYADGQMSEEKLKKASQSIQLSQKWSSDPLDENYLFVLARSVTNPHGLDTAMCSVAYWREPDEIEAKWSALCDIVGPIPFRAIPLSSAWFTSRVTTLAQTIYNDRAFGRMPELADALQEAGCDHQDVLSHCRGPGPHVKGCWVVDLLLGKE